MNIKGLLLLFLILPMFMVAQQKVEVDVSNPNATIYTHIYFLQEDSYQPASAAKAIYGVEEKKAIDIAVKIKRVLDGKGLLIDFNKVPKNSNYTDTIQEVAVHKYVLFPERMPLISVTKQGESWYYSQETINNIDVLYDEIFPWYIDKLQEVVPGAGHRKVFGIELWQYAAVVVLLIVVFLIVVLVKRFFFILLIQLFKRYLTSGNNDIKQALKKLAHPLALLVGIWVIDRVFPSLQFSLAINKWVFLAIDIAVTVFWIYVFLKLATVLTSIYQSYAQKTQRKLDDQLVPILKNFLTGIIIIAGAFKMLTIFGMDPTTILAGASIGGLAIAFASQDTVKNLIGTVMIFVDKPFHIGDWISAGEVVGTVEEVGFRSTLVRASDTTVYQIPNSKLSELVINNAGLRVYRRYNTTLGLRYDTPPELIEAFVKGVRELIKAHPDTRKDAFNVEFTGFGDSALEILVNMYFHDLAWGKEQESKHQIHLAIVRLAAGLGVDFAFPSTTVMIEQFPEKKIIAPTYDSEAASVEAVIQKTIDDFKKTVSDS